MGIIGFMELSMISSFEKHCYPYFSLILYHKCLQKTREKKGSHLELITENYIINI